MSKKSKETRLKSIGKKKKILMFFEILSGILVFAAAIILFVPGVKAMVVSAVSQTSLGRNLIKYYGKEAYDENVYDVEFDEKNIQTNDDLKYSYSTEYTNFVVFGIDSRDTTFDSGTNSDTIIIVSIHNETKEIKMTSVYRDTYLRVYQPDGSTEFRKVNAAYSWGGASGAINTLNKNLDLDISDYVTVNWSGVSKIIDTLGGIEVNLTQDEMNELNRHLEGTCISTGEPYVPLTQYGENIRLSGVQATTYCRIRKVTFYDPETGDAISNDYGRAARQRSVIMKLVDKAKGASIEEITDMVNVVLDSSTDEDPILKTSFTLDEIINFIPIIFDFQISGSEGFPRKLAGVSMGSSLGDVVVPKGLARNVSLLHEFLFGEENYDPTATVQEIDQEIYYNTGITADMSDDEVDDVIRKSTESNEDLYSGEGETSAENFDYDDGGDSEFMR